MNDNLTTEPSNETENPAFLVGAVRRSLFFVRWDLRILIRNENEKTSIRIFRIKLPRR